MVASSTTLEFGDVLCGQCKIVTVRLENQHTVQ